MDLFRYRWVTLLDYAFSTVGLVTCLICLMTWLWYRKPPKYPPGPRGFPILGVLPYLSQYPERDFAKWKKIYGPLISLPMGWQNWIVIHDYDLIIETLVKYSEQFHGRPHLLFYDIARGKSGGIVFNIGGPKWKRQRQFGSAAMKSFSKQKIETRIIEELRYFSQEIQNQKGKPFNIQQFLTTSAANILCSVVFGRRFDYDDEKFREIVKNLGDQFKLASHWMTMVLTFVPTLCYAPFPPFSTHVESSRKQLSAINEHIRQIIEEHRLSFDPNDIRDVVDQYLLKELEEIEPNIPKDDVGLFLDFFIAGTETTASSMRWALLCLAIKQDVQRKCQEEIDKVLGRDGVPSMTHRSNLPYICATLQEILRFKAVTPLALPRRVTQDVEIRGYHIPKDTKVFINLWQLHYDEAIWKDPWEFKPERHLDDDGCFRHSKHVMPFSVGARACLGEQMARMEMFLTLVVIMQKFLVRLNPADPDPPTFDSGTNGTIYIPKAFDLVMDTR
ncbi:unnamed protein product [Clavelina lepadiformis]|uniref:Cytochrome P450 n=1 Tax=Clavelina lepadiformis TaxID=159417 RepID=A0ABP0G3R1_CLALP